MVDKEKICAAFCDEISIRQVPDGYAVKTGFYTADGDPIGFYVVKRPDNPKQWRLEDSGVIVPMLEAHGVTLNVGQREQTFNDLLSEHHAAFDENSQEIVSRWLTEDELPQACLNFVALLLRLQDMEAYSMVIFDFTYHAPMRD